MVTNYGGILGGGAVPVTGSGIVQTGQSGITQSRQGDTITNNNRTGGSSGGSRGGGGGSRNNPTYTISNTDSFQSALKKSNETAKLVTQLQQAGTFTPDSLSRIFGNSRPEDVLLRQNEYKKQQALSNLVQDATQRSQVANEAVDSLNKRYGGRQLSQQEYNQYLQDVQRVQALQTAAETTASIAQREVTKYNFSQDKKAKETPKTPLNINQPTTTTLPGQ